MEDSPSLRAEIRIKPGKSQLICGIAPYLDKTEMGSEDLKFTVIDLSI